MRLSRRFAAKGLEFRCAKFIQDNVIPFKTISFFTNSFRFHYEIPLFHLKIKIFRFLDKLISASDSAQFSL